MGRICRYDWSNLRFNWKRLGCVDFPCRNVLPIYYERKTLTSFFWQSIRLFCISCQAEDYPSFGEVSMLKIPSALREQFELCLRNKPVPVSAHGLYIKWLRYYLDFCLKYDFASDQRESLPHFLRKLQEENQSKGQQQQAAEAITFYYELILSMSRRRRSSPSAGREQRMPWATSPAAPSPACVDREPFRCRRRSGRRGTASPSGRR